MVAYYHDKQLDKSTKPEKKRSQPVTAPAVETTAEDSDDDPEEENDEWVDEDNDNEEAMDEDTPASDSKALVKPKDPNASRESHKAQKALHEQRRAAKPHSELLSDAKRVWSLARQNNIPTTERRKHIQELMDVIRGKVKEIVFKHDASRIVQTVVKYGGQKERDEIAEELKGRFKELAQNKYSKFLVTKLIRLCPTHRASILTEFQGSVIRLLLHREATSVLADTFELYANAYERSILLLDFYGKETLLFKTSGGSDEEKERAKKGLRGVLEGTDVERKRRVLSALKENLVTIYNNPDKGAVTHAVVHRALWEYLYALCDLPDEAEREKLRHEIFETCQEVLAEMVHTKDGSRVVREFLAYGTAKDRKQILKVLKPHIERMCLDDDAQMVLFTALDVIEFWTAITAVNLLAPSFLTITNAIPVATDTTEPSPARQLQNEHASRSLSPSDLPHQPVALRSLAEEYSEILPLLFSSGGVTVSSLQNMYAVKHAYRSRRIDTPSIQSIFETFLLKWYPISEMDLQSKWDQQLVEQTVEVIVIADYMVSEEDPCLRTDNGQEKLRWLIQYLHGATSTLSTKTENLYGDLGKLIGKTLPKYEKYLSDIANNRRRISE
ncbi:hypothetical protein H0H93_015495 [Arthromyces matolae]|nr:hypothetical protein H0H93_015495 [Arthromyces matolae]